MKAGLVLEQPLEKSWPEKVGIFLIVVIPLLAVLYATTQLWQRYVNGLELTLLLTFYVVSRLGITAGHHRLLTHGSFDTKPWVKALLLISGAMAFEGKPGDWASNHLEHHGHSDAEGDPHSPLVILWRSHVGRMFTPMPRLEICGPWLRKDKVVRLQMEPGESGRRWAWPSPSPSAAGRGCCGAGWCASA